METAEAKRYEILAGLPAYGPMYIPVTESGEEFYSQGFAVRFYKADGTNWVANFQPGWTSFSDIQKLENSANVVVVAGGTCYLMNPEETRPITVFRGDVAGIFRLADGRFVLQNSIDLTIVEPNGAYWHSARISWDSLKDLTLSGTMLAGFSFDPINEEQLVAFTYNIDTKELTGGSYHLYEMGQSVEKPKSWWKFW
ncbi:hypothetical protein GCM10027422_03190 [Hymenobacter arcticus]